MSVSGKSRRRGAILDEIMRHHRRRLPAVMREVPLADLRAVASLLPPPADFAGALAAPGVSLIAECKKASPSRGLIARDYDPRQLALAFARAGASAVSVLTDTRHFQGTLEHLRVVKEALAGEGLLSRGDPRRRTGIPVLRKDFIFDPYQIVEARAAGADAILLIAAVLKGGELKTLLHVAGEWGLGALVEVHTDEELDRVLELGPTVVGVNNRDLQTFEVDFANTERLRRRIPPGTLVVAESGIRGPDDVQILRDLGIDAVLVGESLVRSRDPFVAARALVEAGRRS